MQDLIARAEDLAALCIPPAAGLVRELIAKIEEQQRELARLTAMANNVLDPEMYGFAVTKEVRDAARRALGAQRHPNCGACSGDGSICTHHCRLAAESPATETPA